MYPTHHTCISTLSPMRHDFPPTRSIVRAFWCISHVVASSLLTHVIPVSIVVLVRFVTHVDTHFHFLLIINISILSLHLSRPSFTCPSFTCVAPFIFIMKYYYPHTSSVCPPIITLIIAKYTNTTPDPYQSMCHHHHPSLFKPAAISCFRRCLWPIIPMQVSIIY